MASMNFFSIDTIIMSYRVMMEGFNNLIYTVILMIKIIKYILCGLNSIFQVTSIQNIIFSKEIERNIDRIWENYF